MPRLRRARTPPLPENLRERDQPDQRVDQDEDGDRGVHAREPLQFHAPDSARAASEARGKSEGADFPLNLFPDFSLFR